MNTPDLQDIEYNSHDLLLTVGTYRMAAPSDAHTYLRLDGPELRIGTDYCCTLINCGARSTIQLGATIKHVPELRRNNHPPTSRFN